MNFGLIDRVLELEPGNRIVAVKAVTLAEEYLSEHFPSFPVLPGVFMLECMVEAARWLVHASHDFARSMVLLESARGITYKSFVAPGQLLRVHVECRRLSDDHSGFSGVGFGGEKEVVKGRFDLRHFNLVEKSPDLAAADRRILEQARQRWSLIRPVEHSNSTA